MVEELAVDDDGEEVQPNILATVGATVGSRTWPETQQVIRSLQLRETILDQGAVGHGALQ